MQSDNSIKVFILDDEKDVCLLLSMQLNEQGIQTRYANDLAAAKPALGDFHPDVVLLDIHLPDGSGYDIVPYIRRECPEARILIISAYPEDYDRDKAARFGIEAIIVKPFSGCDVLEAIR